MEPPSHGPLPLVVVGAVRLAAPTPWSRQCQSSARAGMHARSLERHPRRATLAGVATAPTPWLGPSPRRSNACVGMRSRRGRGRALAGATPALGCALAVAEAPSPHRGWCGARVGAAHPAGRRRRRSSVGRVTRSCKA
jgi:hypothetical protein